MWHDILSERTHGFWCWRNTNKDWPNYNSLRVSVQHVFRNTFQLVAWLHRDYQKTSNDIAIQIYEWKAEGPSRTEASRLWCITGFSSLRHQRIRANQVDQRFQIKAPSLSHQPLRHLHSCTWNSPLSSRLNQREVIRVIQRRPSPRLSLLNLALWFWESCR